MPNLVIGLTTLRFALFEPRDPPTNPVKYVVISRWICSDVHICICRTPLYLFYSFSVFFIQLKLLWSQLHFSIYSLMMDFLTLSLVVSTFRYFPIYLFSKLWLWKHSLPFPYYTYTWKTVMAILFKIGISLHQFGRLAEPFRDSCHEDTQPNTGTRCVATFVDVK